MEQELQEKLKAFGCSDEFVKICMYYKEIYRPEIDIEEFVEYVEEAYAKIEDEKFEKELQKVDASQLFSEIEGEEEL